MLGGPTDSDGPVTKKTSRPSHGQQAIR